MTRKQVYKSFSVTPWTSHALVPPGGQYFLSKIKNFLVQVAIPKYMWEMGMWVELDKLIVMRIYLGVQGRVVMRDFLVKESKSGKR